MKFCRHGTRQHVVTLGCMLWPQKVPNSTNSSQIRGLSLRSVPEHFVDTELKLGHGLKPSSNATTAYNATEAMRTRNGKIPMSLMQFLERFDHPRRNAEMRLASIHKIKSPDPGAKYLKSCSIVANDDVSRVAAAAMSPFGGRGHNNNSWTRCRKMKTVS